MKDIEYMKKAHEIALKSTCIRAQVGAVIVKDNAIIATGYNNVVGGIKPCNKVGCLREQLNIPSGERRELCRNICAEQLAISEAARNGIELDGAEAYVTTFPCHICAKLLVSSGISRIYYAKDYPDKLSKDFLNEAGIEYKKIDY